MDACQPMYNLARYYKTCSCLYLISTAKFCIF